MSEAAYLVKRLLMPSFVVYLALLSGCAVNETYVSSGAEKNGSIVIGVASAQNTDPFEAGKEAAEMLLDKTGQPPLHTVVLAECFEGRAQKKQALKGVCSILPKEIVFGFSTFKMMSLTISSVSGRGIKTCSFTFIFNPKKSVSPKMY